MSTFRRSAISVGAAAIGLAAATAGIAPASADSVQCGDVITADTVLTEDLTCGAGDALIIGADDVTLDLGGHTLTGPGAYTAGSGAGVRAAQRNGVTVTHGTITGFRSAVVLDQSWDSFVTKLAAQGSDQAINVAGGGRHVIEKNVVTESGRDAIRLGLSVGNRVTQNNVSANVYGIAVADGSSGNTVDRNVLSGNRDFGIAAWGPGSGNVIEKNQVSGSVRHGIQVNSDIAGITVLQNYVSGNGDDGIHVDTVHATLTRNTAVYNVDLGISAPTGVTDGGGNKASGNGNVLQCTGVVCNPAF